MNYNKVIKDLKERNNKLENQRRQFEIRLINEQYLVEKKDKEIERLNNIIDEITAISNERLNYYYHIKDKEHLEEWEEIIDALKLDKLKELKGSDK